MGFDEALNNLKRIVKEEKAGLQQFEEEQEILRGLNDKKNNLMNMSHYTNGYTPKSNKHGKLTHQMEEDRKINKLTLENSIISEKLKGINFEIDKFIKEQLSQSKRPNSYFPL